MTRIAPSRSSFKGASKFLKIWIVPFTFSAATGPGSPPPRNWASSKPAENFLEEQGQGAEDPVDHEFHHGPEP